jgi:flagellar biosynthesis protein FlhF
MKVKTYKHESLQEGLEKIKKDLGSDALILSTRSVTVRPRFRLFKKPVWEITAAVQESNAQQEIKKRAENPLSLSLPKFAAPAASAAVAPAPAPVSERVRVVDERMDALIDEISGLKKSMQTLSRSIPANPQPGGGLFAELVGQGIDQDLADRFIADASKGNPAPTELRERVRRLIADQPIIAPAAELHAKTRLVTALVGPTGVGKTTTIAKIAGHALIRMKKKVAVISTDMFRVGGQEQLIRFGELLGVPAYGCSDVSSLKELVASLADCDLVLIDTPGSSPSDLARLAKLESVTSAANARVHLVISATTRSEDITKIIIRFQRFKPDSVIFTKTDEIDSQGTLAGDLLRNDLPVSYVTNGQRVPEDLLIPSGDDLARSVLPVEPS